MTSHGRLLVAASAVALALTACGGDDPADKSSGSAPVCSELWVVGNTVPTGYSGCAETAGGGRVAATARQCDDGRQLTRYQDRLWAFIGEGVQEGSSQSPGYQAAAAAC